MRNPDNLTEEDEQRLSAILARCPLLTAASRHVGAFAVMIRDLNGSDPLDWISHVRADNLHALHSFTADLRRDHARDSPPGSPSMERWARRGCRELDKNAQENDVRESQNRPSSRTNPARFSMTDPLQLHAICDRVHQPDKRHVQDVCHI
ncbi:hypothetical protein [Amycolatopsis sp. NPDC004079]|uniref:hypothetical protein n=1 Tax=Amycolatopsis sp. NPDC004079 TaxID=3154549 RepID=UPI0033A44190